MVAGPPDARVKLVIAHANVGGRHATPSDCDRALARNSPFDTPCGRRVACAEAEGSRVTLYQSAQCRGTMSHRTGSNITSQGGERSALLDYPLRRPQRATSGSIAAFVAMRADRRRALFDSDVRGRSSRRQRDDGREPVHAVISRDRLRTCDVFRP